MPKLISTAQKISLPDLDALSEKCQAILNREDVSDLDNVFQKGGSSGGARPKVMTGEWVIKFPASGDMKDVGRMEKEYMDCAAECGIVVPETKLMSSRICDGYFAVRRFDRERAGDKLIRHHMLTAAAILEQDWRSPTLDYHTKVFDEKRFLWVNTFYDDGNLYSEHVYIYTPRVFYKFYRVLAHILPDSLTIKLGKT